MNGSSCEAFTLAPVRQQIGPIRGHDREPEPNGRQTLWRGGLSAAHGQASSGTW